MIVLDTNVISEPDKPLPDFRVMDWLNGQRQAELYLSTPIVAELAGGGHRIRLRTGSSKYLDRLRLIVDREFSGRVLGFSLEAADACGVVRAKREQLGRRLARSTP